jgi:DNA-binding Lrp family transcriptional regulator
MVKAFVLVNCEIGAEKQVIDELRTISGVKEAHGVMGAYDIMAEVESPSREELRKTIIWKIRKIQMIRSTLTLMGIEGQEYSTY